MSRVLVATLSFFPENHNGVARVAYDWARKFSERGHEVWLLCQDSGRRGLEREHIDGITVLRYRLGRNRIPWIWRYREHVSAAVRVLIRHLPLPPDIVHGHTPLQYLSTLRLYAGRSRFCYTIHSPAVEEMRIAWSAQGLAGWLKTLPGLPIIRGLERHCLRSSHMLDAKSQYTRFLIGRYYGEAIAQKIGIIPHWVDMEHFRPLVESTTRARGKLGWPTDRPVFFTLRRLQTRMGLDNLLQALRIVHHRGYRFHAVIGGTGPQIDSLVKLRAYLGLEDEVTFMGFVPDEMLPLAYGACDASVVPSAHLECFGIIVLEALACGRPVLVTPVGALPEVVGQFEPRWIAPGSSPEDIASHLCAYLEGGLPTHDAGKLRETLREHYASEKALDRWELLLKNCS